MILLDGASRQGAPSFAASPSLAIDGGVSVGFGKFGTVRIDADRHEVNTANSTIARLMAGLSWYPSF